MLGGEARLPGSRSNRRESPLRGVPGAIWNEDGGLPAIEAHTGRLSIFIKSESLVLDRAALDALTPLNDLAPLLAPGQALPVPAPGAVEGLLRCHGRNG